MVPISINHFTLQKVSHSVKLIWSTDQEVNSKEFIIERSSNGRNWKELSRVTAAGNSSRRTDYFYSDFTPAFGTNYYRLKMIDLSGRFEYTAVRIAGFNKGSALLVSPNPAKDFLNVEYVKTNSGPIVVTLSDANGKTISQTRTVESIIKIDVRNVAKGTYLVYITDGDKVISEKVMIQ